MPGGDKQREHPGVSIDGIRDGRYRVSRRIIHVMRTFTAVFEQKPTCWIGWIEELPGANTQGATLDEARENLKEAARLVVEANRTLAGNRSAEGTVVREDLLVNV